MPTFILILSFYAGSLSHGDSVSLTSAEFTSEARCLAAGQKASDTFSTLVKPVKFICTAK